MLGTIIVYAGDVETVLLLSKCWRQMRHADATRIKKFIGGRNINAHSHPCVCVRSFWKPFRLCPPPETDTPVIGGASSSSEITSSPRIYKSPNRCNSGRSCRFTRSSASQVIKVSSPVLCGFSYIANFKKVKFLLSGESISKREIILMIDYWFEKIDCSFHRVELIHFSRVEWKGIIGSCVTLSS
jgi:hypothetical protein